MKTRNKLLRGLAVVLVAGMLLVFASTALARDVRYDGGEVEVYVTPGEPTQVTFPAKVAGGFKPKDSRVALEKQDNFLVLFASPGLRLEGEGIIVQVDDKRTYSLRVRPADQENPRDGAIKIDDLRPPEILEEEPEASPGRVERSPVSKLMRNIIKVAEFGRKRGVAGFRRSNEYSGETVLHDGAIVATIDEIFMGSDLWAYVLNVQNLLDTTQRINPATFRLDGTRAISASRWELAPRPQTVEQQVAQAHEGKVYIITRAKR